MAEKKNMMNDSVNRWSDAQECKKKKQKWEDMLYDPAMWGDDIPSSPEDAGYHLVEEAPEEQQDWGDLMYDPAIWGDDIQETSGTYRAVADMTAEEKNNTDVSVSENQVETDKSNSVDETVSDENNKINLVKVTARINEAVHEVIKEIAEEYGVSFSEVVRLSIDGHLEKYLGTIQYMDKSQGKEIIQRCTQLANEMQGIRNELHRIGVNVNQMSKCNNLAGQINQLYEAHYQEPDRKKKMEIYRHIRALETAQWAIDFDRVDYDAIVSCMDRYEKASKEVADALWHIQG